MKYDYEMGHIIMNNSTDSGSQQPNTDGRSAHPLGILKFGGLPFKLLLALSLILIALTTNIVNADSPATYYIKTDGDGDGDGKSWGSAGNVTLLRTLLSDGNGAAGAGDIIYVAVGTYTPAGSDGDRAATFKLNKGVRVYGGFDGTETGGHSAMLAARKISQNKTTLTGDLNNNDNSDSTRGDNSYHVVTGDSGADRTTVLDGFTITGGNANGAAPGQSYGGGMYNSYSSPTVASCTFSENSATGGTGGNGGKGGDGCGGGMYNDNSSPTVTSCTFSENSVKGGDGGDGGDGIGGGMYNDNSSPTVTNCTFSNNSATGGKGGDGNGDGGDGGGGGGGGMYNDNSIPTVANCTFSENSVNGGRSGLAINPGGGGYGDGGGVYNNSSSPTLTNCTFSNNSASGYDCNGSGGGVYNNSSSPTLTNCTFSKNSAIGFAGYGGGMYNNSSSPTLTNCTFSGNSVTGYGGGGGMYNNSGSSPTVTNCTFSGNSANGGGGKGGGMYNDNSSPTLTNCILWGNTATTGNEISGGNAANFTKCVIQGGFNGGVDIINSDPKLGQLADNGGPTETIAITDANSPAIGAGVKSKQVNGKEAVPSVDQRGFKRKSGRPDIGAFELNAKPIITATAGEGGTIYPTGNLYVESNANKTFTFTPNAGYLLDTVTVDGGVAVPTNNQYTFTNVTANHTINVTFKKKTYDFTASVTGVGGRVTVSPTGNVVHGSDVTLTITPDAGYVLDVLKVNGDKRTNPAFSNGTYTYTVQSITAAVTVTVTFKRIATPAPDYPQQEGPTVNITLTPGKVPEQTVTPGEPQIPGTPIKPNENGRLENTPVPGSEGTAAVTNDGGLQRIGVTPQLSGGRVVLNGEPKAVGTFTMTVTTDGGTSKEITVTIEPLRRLLTDMISTSETRTGWLVTLIGSKDRPAIELVFPVYVPYDPNRQSDHEQGASVDIAGGADISATPHKTAGKTSKKGTEMLIKVTGTVESRSTFEIKSVRCRIGAVEYEQSTSIKLSDMNVTDRSTSASRTGGGCNAGFAGFALSLLALLVLKRKG